MGTGRTFKVRRGWWGWEGQGLEGKEVDDHETFCCSYIILASLLCDLVIVSPAWSLVDICIDLLHRLASSMWPR